jgi:diguanylate cyclase
MYHAGPAREALTLFYPVVMLFGMLKLNAARLMVLALVTLAAHATMLILLLLRNPRMEAGAALTEFAVLMVVLPWFAAMGGYVSRLRSRLADSNRELQAAYERIEGLAMRDELTGAYNRRYLMEVLKREGARAERLRRPLSVCILDVDHFKSINDTLGHAAGDAVLRKLPELLGAGIRAVDVLGRYGGEEFLLVLPDTDVKGACALAERARAAVAEAQVPQLPAGRRVSVTIGVAQLGSGETVNAALGRADRALYDGKAAGRNRVVVG